MHLGVNENMKTIVRNYSNLPCPDSLFGQIENVNNISIVDMGTAERLGDRTIGSIKNSAWFEVDDEYNLIEYNGELFRISALNYGGLFKYNKANETGIPGYVLVNTATQEAKFVELSNSIKYSPSAFWSYDLKRHLRNEYPSLTLMATSALRSCHL